MAMYRVRCSKAAAQFLGQQKQAVIEDAVGRIANLKHTDQTVVILQVNHLPLRLVIQVADQIIDILTNEEADKCGVMNPPPANSKN
jgi:hypothetical protein